MMHCFYRSKGEILSVSDLQKMAVINAKDIIWVDLLNSTEEEKGFVEHKLGIELFTRQEAEEIESSSKYFESEQEINANLNYIFKKDDDTYSVDPVSFILKDDKLITQRNIPLRSFDDVKRLLRISRRASFQGHNIFLLMFETRIDIEADVLEDLSKKIYHTGRKLALDQRMDEDILIEIYNLQETTILFRESTSELKRLFSSILRSDYYPKDEYEKMRVLIKDADSLLGHTSFNFERLEYLQNTFLGLIDIQQNKIIKIFTIVTVVFMPPTLIASLYGMNFHVMPELNWQLGYPFAILLMVMSSLFTLYYFKRNDWL